MHFFNATFALLGVLGLFIFTKKIFNKNIAYISAFLTLLNPFFFGHIGMNSKDIIIFFSLIWFCNYFYSYCVDENKKIKNIILASVFVGFGCGVRLTFLITILPCVIIGLVFLIQKYRSNYLNLFKRLIAHILISLLIVVFLIIICWPHMIVEIKNDNFINFFFNYC
jgi:4-amino-4-deoxy-L-arabinose transferase-like glycosyltransferase